MKKNMVRALAFALVVIMALSILPLASFAATVGTATTEVAKPAADDLHYFGSSLTVAELAQRACVSEAYFRRKFAQQFGMSPKKYIESARMNYAVSLLQTQYYTQQEISEMCGYSDVKYFRTAFKKYTGACLSKYKYIFD